MKKEIIDTREALIEMYKAGFLDGYKYKKKLRNKTEWAEMNKIYKLAFLKRFEKQINKVIREDKKNG